MKEIKQKLPVVFRRDTRANWDLKEMTPKRVILRPIQAVVDDILGDRQHFICHHDEYMSTCIAGKIFWRKVLSSTITFKGGRLYGQLTPYLVDVLKEGFNLNWMEPWTLRLIRQDKNLWKEVFSGKITNPEMLCKRFSKRYFKGVYSYKVLREYFKNNIGYPSLWVIYYHTTNPNLLIQKFKKAMELQDKDWHKYGNYTSLYEDVLAYCQYDNSKINPMWSRRRLQEEHQKQIEKDAASEAAMYSDKDIYPQLDNNVLSLITNERQCFIEGNLMHNCVHRCYWRRVAEGSYIIATGEIQDVKVDIGIRVMNNKILLIDQIHSIYNGNVSTEVTSYCNDWIDSHKEELLSRIDFINKNKVKKEDPLNVLPNIGEW